MHALLDESLPSESGLNTHSFRIRGASIALTPGASDSMICIKGRWSRDCYLCYLHISDSDITKFISNIAKVSGVLSTWHADKWKLMF